MKAFETCTAPEVPEATYKRFLRFPPTRALEGAMAEAADWARNWYAEYGRPWIAHTAVEMEIKNGQQLVVEGLPMGDARIAQFFGRVSGEGRLVFACAGIEAEHEAQRLWDADEPDTYYFLEAYSAAVTESLLTRLRAQLQARESAHTWTSHRCPGHGKWNILDNLQLLRIARQSLELPLEVEVLQSGMLRPKKSLLGLMGRRLQAPDA
ncbi:MAG: hypothetical protein JJU20_01865 [Opitutales bacterium]|nr:hypothetical protein [Opitutales bacterium]